MAKFAIRIAESALAELESLRSWYADQDVHEAVDRLDRDPIACIEALVDQPDMGRMVREFDQPFLCELIRPPFRIVYRRDPKQVRVVAGARGGAQVVYSRLTEGEGGFHDGRSRRFPAQRAGPLVDSTDGHRRQPAGTLPDR